jgi:hypothetical protein
MNRAPTNVLLAARGHDLNALQNPELGTERWQLARPTVQRVEAVAEYFHANRTAFEDAYAEGGGGVIVASGGYATMATGNQIPPPPYKCREGFLMLRDLVEIYGVPPQHVQAATSPTTTLEVILRPLEEGHFSAIGPENPWAICSQRSQLPRLLYLGSKATGLSEASIVPVIAPGEEDPRIAKDEAHLLLITKALYGPARSFAGLRRAERVAGGVSSVISRVRPSANPAEKYLRQGQ